MNAAFSLSEWSDSFQKAMAAAGAAFKATIARVGESIAAVGRVRTSGPLADIEAYIDLQEQRAAMQAEAHRESRKLAVACPLAPRHAPRSQARERAPTWAPAIRSYRDRTTLSTHKRQVR